MARAYKVRWASYPTHNPDCTKAYTVLMAESMFDVYQRLAAGAFEEAKMEGELHITPLGEVK